MKNNKIKTFWNEHKDTIKNTTIAVLACGCMIGVVYAREYNKLIDKEGEEILSVLKEHLE